MKDSKICSGTGPARNKRIWIDVNMTSMWLQIRSETNSEGMKRNLLLNFNLHIFVEQIPGRLDDLNSEVLEKEDTAKKQNDPKQIAWRIFAFNLQCTCKSSSRLDLKAILFLDPMLQQIWLKIPAYRYRIIQYEDESNEINKRNNDLLKFP